MASESTNTPVWLITGCSTGFGRELAKLVIARGWRLVATARDKSRVADLAGAQKARCWLSISTSARRTR